MATLKERMDDDSTVEEIIENRIQFDDVLVDLNKVALQRKYNPTKIKAIELCIKLKGANAPEKHELTGKDGGPLLNDVPDEERKMLKKLTAMAAEDERSKNK